MIEAWPFISIPSRVYFRFAIARIKALERLQMNMASLHPKNLATLTGINCFHLQTVISTPEIVPSPIRRALKEMRCEQVVERRGMFFYQDDNFQLFLDALSKGDRGSATEYLERV